MVKKEEIISLFEHRRLNEKTNNFIFTGVHDLSLLDEIPSTCAISLPDHDLDIDFAHNIKIDLQQIEVKDIFTYTFELLKKYKLFDVSFDYTIDFQNRRDLLRAQGTLRRYNQIIQLIFYHFERLSIEEQMLFNEIYYFNSIFFNANSFIEEEYFKTHFLSQDRVLDDRENYTKVRLRQLNIE